MNSKQQKRQGQTRRTEWIASLKRTDGELEVIRALANGKVTSARHRAVLDFLRDYEFLDPEHQVVYESLREIARLQPISQSQLAVHLNNCGFPDIDIEKYYEGTPLDLIKALELARVLPDLK